MGRWKLAAIVVMSALAGALLLFLWTRGRASLPPPEEDLLANPLAQMQRMQDAMDEDMRAHLDSFGEAAGAEVVRREDEHSVYFEILGVDATKLSASVRERYLTITGETRHESGGAVFSSSFRRILSLPPEVDAQQMETTSEKDKVVLRFPKRKAH